MKQNYYDILEINQNASPEIVEKAYKTLAKKYHPDLQENSLKKDSEEKLKKINEAYEVLSDPQKRENYDASLNMQKMESEKLTEELLNQNEILKNELNNIQNNSNPNNSQTNLRYEQELEMARQKAYHDAYIQDLKNRGYKIKYKKTWKDYFKNLVALLITIGVLFIIFQIPFVKNFLFNIYQENPLVHTFIDNISNIFSLFK